MDTKTDRDDVARVLLALQSATPERLADVEPKLQSVLAEYVSTDLSHITKDTSISAAQGFRLILKRGAPILLGGGGVVIQATNSDVATLKYAIKAQRPSLLQQPSAVIDSERAFAEYIYHAPLSSENIARLFAVWKIDVLSSGRESAPHKSTVPLLILEWVDDPEKLSPFIRQRIHKPFQFIDVMSQCFGALEHLHAKNLIHWDIKSDNLLVSKTNNKVKLMDIGNARRKHGTPSTDLVALTTDGNYPPILARFAKPRVSGDSSNRIQLDLDSTKWDNEWLDMWMLARELAEIVGIGDGTLDHSLFAELPAAWLNGDTDFVARAFSSKHRDAVFVLRYVRLILRRLLYPKSVDEPRYYQTASDVLHDLAKLVPEFGAGQDVVELKSIPQNVIRIPVGGNVPLTPRVKDIVSSHLLTRLRSHRQLGTISSVYPGTAHNRFEHSIGVFCAVCEYVKALYADRTNPFWRISVEAEDIEALLLAALLHDAGHLAYGHFLEEMGGLFADRTHEAYAIGLLRGHGVNPTVGSDLWEESIRSDHSALVDVVKGKWAHRLRCETLLDQVAAILDTPRDHEVTPEPSNPLFRSDSELVREDTEELKREILHSIINSAIDADKYDYLRRDGLHAGIDYPKGIDSDRFLQALTTLHHVPMHSPLSTNEELKSKLCASIAVTEKGLLPVESILFARYQMFQAVYWHHTARAHTAMLQFCIGEYLLSTPEGPDRAFITLADVFRKFPDEAAINWLYTQVERLNAPIQKRLLDVCDALAGERSKA